MPACLLEHGQSSGQVLWELNRSLVKITMWALAQLWASKTICGCRKLFAHSNLTFAPDTNLAQCIVTLLPNMSGMVQCVVAILPCKIMEHNKTKWLYKKGEVT